MGGDLLLKGFKQNLTRIVLYNPYFNSVFDNFSITALLNNKELIAKDFEFLFQKGDTLRIEIQSDYYAIVKIKAVPIGLITDIPRHQSSDPAYFSDNIIRLEKAINRDGIVIASVLSEMSKGESLYVFTSLNEYEIIYRPADFVRYCTVKVKTVIPAFEYITFNKTQFLTQAMSHGNYRFLQKNDFTQFLQHIETFLVVYTPLFIVDIYYIDQP